MAFCSFVIPNTVKYQFIPIDTINEMYDAMCFEYTLIQKLPVHLYVYFFLTWGSAKMLVMTLMTVFFCI